jgi:hypothetical protein
MIAVQGLGLQRVVVIVFIHTTSLAFEDSHHKFRKCGKTHHTTTIPSAKGLL